jgi:hypothetical protein
MCRFCNMWMFVCVVSVICECAYSCCVGLCMRWFCNMWVCVCGFCNMLMCVCVDFVMCRYVYMWVFNRLVYVCVGSVMYGFVYVWGVGVCMYGFWNVFICIFYCVYVGVFFNVLACVCVGFVLCGCVYVWVLWYVGVCMFWFCNVWVFLQLCGYFYNMFTCFDVFTGCIDVFTLGARQLARSQCSESPATGHLDTGFSRFPCVS